MPVNFKRSLPMSRIRREDICSLKLHFPKGAVREVVGYLHKLAANDPERFVYASVDDIVQHCNRYEGPGYKKGIIEKVLRFLRDLRVLSKAVERDRWVFGNLRKVRGFIVTPHDSLCQLSVNRCDFVGWTRASGTWRSDGKPGGARWWIRHRGTGQGTDADTD